jgi:hypothetical protein
MTAEPEVPPVGDPDIRYYQVELDVQEGRPPEAIPPLPAPGRRGGAFWALVALGVLIVVLVVALVVLEVADGRAVESSVAGWMVTALSRGPGSGWA